MIVNVAQLLKADVGTTRQYEVEDWIDDLSDQAKLTEPVRGTVQLMRTNRGILARGSFRTAAQLECSRCLDVLVQDLRFEFTEEYVPIVDVRTGLPVDIPHESYTYRIDEKHELDLEPAEREYALLELPMQPLCKTDCAGLCPQCGVNRNQQTCTCVVRAEDDRFAILRTLLSDEDKAN